MHPWVALPSRPGEEVVPRILVRKLLGELRKFGRSPRRHVCRNNDDHLGKKITRAFRRRNPTTLHAKDAPARRARCDLEFDRNTAESGHLDRRTERSFNECNGHTDLEIEPVPFEHRMLAHPDRQHEVARLATVGGGMSLSPQFYVLPSRHTP